MNEIIDRISVEHNYYNNVYGIWMCNYQFNIWQFKKKICSKIDLLYVCKCMAFFALM